MPQRRGKGRLELDPTPEGLPVVVSRDGGRCYRLLIGGETVFKTPTCRLGDAYALRLELGRRGITMRGRPPRV